MALFLGTSINKVDRKGRVSVPSAFRNAIADPTFHGIVGFPSFTHAAIECCTMGWLEELHTGVSRYHLFSEDHDDIATAVFSRTRQMAFDGDGRIVLPEHFREHTEIKDQAVFVGRGDTFHIWSPQAHQAFDEATTARLAKKKLTLATGRTPPGANSGGTGGGP